MFDSLEEKVVCVQSWGAPAPSTSVLWANGSHPSPRSANTSGETWLEDTGHNSHLWLVQMKCIVARWAVINQLALILACDWSIHKLTTNDWMFRSRQNYSVPKHLFKFDGELEEEEESEEEDLVDTEEDDMDEEDQEDTEEVGHWTFMKFSQCLVKALSFILGEIYLGTMLNRRWNMVNRHEIGYFAKILNSREYFVYACLV